MAHIDTGFSKRLIALRQERGIPQAALGKILQIPRSTISGYESEGKEPDYNTLSQMADFFGVSADYLLGRSDERRPCDIVFHKNAGVFKKNYEALPKEIRDIVTETLDSFYSLLSDDVEKQDAGALSIYRDLAMDIRACRKYLNQTASAIKSGVLATTSVSAVFAKQAELKTKIGTSLDALLERDMNA